jgi:hypothetical protein
MFCRTQNENGTFNILCLDCLMTIASGIGSPSSLATFEMKHMCVEKALGQLCQANRTHSMGAGQTASHI